MDAGTAEQIPFHHELTTTDDTARRAARAFLRWQLRRSGPIAIIPLLATLLAILVRGGRVTADRVIGVAMWSAVLTFGLCAAILAIGYVRNLGSLARTAPAGTALRSGFGEHGFVTASAVGTAYRSYDSVTTIAVVDGFVLTTYRGSPRTHIHPTALFPTEVIERLEATAPPAPRKPPGWAIAALIVCLPLVLALAGLRDRYDEPAFCDDLRRLDEPVAALRAAKAGDDFDIVPARLAALAAAYRSIDPPDELREDWATAVGFLRFAERSAQAVIAEGQPLLPSAEEDARFGAAMSNITTYAVDTCDDRVRSLLVH